MDEQKSVKFQRIQKMVVIMALRLDIHPPEELVLRK